LFWKTTVLVTCAAVFFGQAALWLLLKREKAIERRLTEATSVRALQGQVRAQFEHGYMYYHSNGVPRAYAEAILWYRKAGDHGNSRGQDGLGLNTRLGAGTKIGLALAFLGSVWLLISPLFPGRSIRLRQPLVTILAGLFGLLWVGLSLYGFSHTGLIQSASAVYAFYFTKDFLAGIFGVMIIFVLWPQSAKIVLRISGILLIGFNVYAIAHYDLRRLAAAIRMFYSANGWLIGIAIPSAIFAWLFHKQSRDKTESGWLLVGPLFLKCGAAMRAEIAIFSSEGTLREQ
jgi:hypothetical protein